MNDNFFLNACAHFFCNDFFIDFDFCEKNGITKKNIADALLSDSLIVNDTELVIADDFSFFSKEDLFYIIDSLATDFGLFFEDGKKFGLNLKADDSSVLALFSEKDLQAEINRRHNSI